MKTHATRTVKKSSASTAAKSNGSSHLVHAAPTLNGVNVTDLVMMTDAARKDPSLAEYSFRASTEWQDGATTETRIQGFWGNGVEDDSRKRGYNIESDQPAVLLGGNKAPNPCELALAALGADLAAGIAYHGAARGIELGAVRVEIEGDLDMRGFLGIREGGKTVRPGFKAARIVCHITSPARPSELRELFDYVQTTSPVLDLFRAPVPISLELEH